MQVFADSTKKLDFSNMFSLRPERGYENVFEALIVIF